MWLRAKLCRRRKNMRAEWKRGLARLWLIGTIFWLGFAVYSRYEDVTYHHELCRDLALDNAKNGRAIYDLDKCHNLELDTALSAIGYAFVPPIIVLLMGIGLFWALKGFRTEGP
jgi:hypothetical protein